VIRPQRAVYPPADSIGGMWQVRFPQEQRPEVLALVSQAERAGWALACPFSSSAEFEAAVIHSRRRAGYYRHMRHRRYALYGAVAAAAITAVGLLTI
jgi:hypothetical protein